MKISTIQHLVERIQHANAAHGKFITYGHALGTARMELAEAKYAVDWQSNDRIVAELLDVAVVCIRAAEQFGGVDG